MKFGNGPYRFSFARCFHLLSHCESHRAQTVHGAQDFKKIVVSLLFWGKRDVVHFQNVSERLANLLRFRLVQFQFRNFGNGMCHRMNGEQKAFDKTGL